MVYGEEGGLQTAGIGDLVGCEVAAWPVQMPRGHLEGLHPPLQATPAASTTAFPSYARVSGVEGGRPGFPLCMPAAPAGGCSMHFVDALQERGRGRCCPQRYGLLGCLYKLACTLHAASQSCSAEALPIIESAVRSAPRWLRAALRALRTAPRPHGALRTALHGAHAELRGAIAEHRGAGTAHRGAGTERSCAELVEAAPELLRVSSSKM